LRQVPFKPRKLDDEIKEQTAAFRLEECNNIQMRNIYVENANIGISTRNTNFSLDNYVTRETRIPLKIRGGENVRLKQLNFQRSGR